VPVVLRQHSAEVKRERRHLHVVERVQVVESLASTSDLRAGPVLAKYVRPRPSEIIAGREAS